MIPEHPSPNACKWCDRDERVHSIEWSDEAGYHNWVAPSDEQRLARMKKRPAHDPR